MISQQSTIHGKYHRFTGYLLGNIDTGLRNLRERESRERQTDETDRQVTDDDVMSESHKSIAQTNRTNEVAQKLLTSLPRME